MMTKMKRLAIVAGSLALGVPFVAHAQDDVIANAAQASVTQDDIAGLLKAVARKDANVSRPIPRRSKVVRSTLAQKAVLAEAKAKGWDKQAQVQAAVEQARREIVVRSYLASVNAPPADYPSDAELQSAYDKNRAAFTAPRAARRADLYRGAAERGCRDARQGAQAGGRSREPRARWRFRGACKSEFAGQGECRERRRSRFRARSIDGAGGPSGGRRAEAGKVSRRSRRQRAFTS